jgi:hypothetical protein
VSTDPAEIKSWLLHAQFWFLEAQFVALLVLTWMNLPDLVRWLRLRPQAVMALLGIAIAAAVLITQVAPRTNRIYFDEHIYQGIAQNMADLHLAQLCNDGQVETGVLNCFRGEYNKEPYGFPYLVSLPFRVFGADESLAHAVNATCTVLLCAVVFLIVCLLFGDQRAAIFGALVLVLIPQHLLWSNTTAAEPSAALMAAFALMTVIHHALQRRWRTLLWMTVAIVFAVQFRAEVALIVPIAVLVCLLYSPRELLRARTLAIAGIGAAIGAAHLVHLWVVKDESWGSAGPKFALEYFWPNLSVNGHYYLGDMRFPVVFTLLAVAGLVLRPSRAAIVPAAAFAGFFGIFLVFYAGSYNFGADIRFAVMSHAWLAILAGRGAAVLTRMAGDWMENDRHAAVAMAALLIMQFLWYLPQVRAIGDEAWAARADINFAKEVIPRLPRNSIVLTHNPSVFHLNGVNAAQMSLVTTDAAYVANHFTERFAGGIFLHWNAWCGYYDAAQKFFCETTLKSFDHELIAEYRERDFRYAFYRLKTAGTIQKVAP